VRVELRRVVARTVPRQMAAADALVDRLALVRLDAALLDAAGRLAPATLGTLDAIHVQSALLFGDELDTMITYDLRQADAARHAGLRVRAPA
jgi:predicted nucleic acid-binding protein